MRRKYHNSGMWDYLDSIGVLEHGSDAEIKAAKKAYRKRYFLQNKRQQRINKSEYTVAFSKANGEHSRIAEAAKKHKRTVTAFIRLAALAYISQTFVVPDLYQIAKLEHILSECLNEIKSIVKIKNKYFWEREERLELVEKRIVRLEQQINEVLRTPPLVKADDHKNQIA
jgi:hypothetical protein